jgi:hypothetical protein
LHRRFERGPPRSSSMKRDRATQLPSSSIKVSGRRRRRSSSTTAASSGALVT